MPGSLATLLKKDSDTRVFQWILQNFFLQNTFSYRTTPVAASVKNVIGLTIFLVSSLFHCVLFLTYFVSTEKWNKKAKYPDGVQIFTFFSSIDLSDVKNFKRNLTDGNLIRKCQREFDVAVFMVRGISLGNGFWVVGGHLTSSSTKTAQTINLKHCTHISNRLLHKTMPAFFL